MTIHIPLQMYGPGAAALRRAANIARFTGGILVAGNRALIVRPARNEREAATVVRLRNSINNSPEAA